MIPVHLVGARGLLAGEFLRLLEAHPELQLAAAYARGGQGTLREHHPHLMHDAELRDPATVGDALRRRKGVDSIQLVKQGGRWWVASITTQFESEGLKVPKSFHPGGSDRK